MVSRTDREGDEENNRENFGKARELSRETTDAMREWEMDALRKQVIEIRKDLDALNKEKEKAMRWGIMALGGAVLGMGSWIINFVSTHINLIQK